MPVKSRNVDQENLEHGEDDHLRGREPVWSTN
jgi:hypothetical protein